MNIYAQITAYKPFLGVEVVGRSDGFIVGKKIHWEFQVDRKWEKGQLWFSLVYNGLLSTRSVQRLDMDLEPSAILTMKTDW